MNTWITEYTERMSLGDGTCRVVTTPAMGTVNINAATSDLKSSVIQGDRLHALPYWRRIVDPVVVAGSIGLKGNSAFSAGPYCGGKRDAEVQGLITPAFFSSHFLPLPMQIDADLDDFLSGASVTKALANARSGYNNVPLLIAERRQTIDMITKRSRQIVDVVKHEQTDAIERYLKTRKSQRRLVAHDIASRHLEVLFGVLPLIGEIEGLAEQLAAEKSIFITGRGRMRNVAETSGPAVETQRNIGINENRNYLAVFANVRKVETRNASSRTSLRYKVDIDAFQKLRDNGFNPIATAYDLVPLSFLSDFVSNLGSWLRAYDPMFGCEYLTGSTTILYEDTVDNVVSGMHRVNGFWTIDTSLVGSVSQAGRYYRRIVHASAPSPTLQWQNNLTPGKLATAAAIAVQRYLKPVRALLKVREFRYRGPRPKFLPPIRYRRP